MRESGLPFILSRSTSGTVRLYEEAEARRVLLENGYRERKEKKQGRRSQEDNLNYADVQLILENLSDEQRYEINERFWEFVDQNPDTEISIADFAIDYLRKKGI